MQIMLARAIKVKQFVIESLIKSARLLTVAGDLSIISPMPNQVPFRKDDQVAVMGHVGRLLPIIFREAVDDGFHRYGVSRQLDPEGFVDYGKCGRGNMLYDRIAASARYLIDSAKDSISDLRYAITPNERSTE